MRARYYNTTIKRFINRDIIEGSITDSTTLNRYSYVEGNPVNLTDPFGLSPSLGSKVIHGVLDAAGDIPYIGCIADTANAIYYAAEGKYGEAVISLICAIPGYGDLFDKIKDIRKVGRGVRCADNLSAITDNAPSIIRNTEKVDGIVDDFWAVGSRSSQNTSLAVITGGNTNKMGRYGSYGRVDGSTKTDFYVGPNGTARSLDEYDAFSVGGTKPKNEKISKKNTNDKNVTISNVNSKRQTPDQKALRDLAKESEKAAKQGNPISEEEAKILDDWADEYSVPQHHKAYSGSGAHFPGGHYSDHTHIYNIHVPYRSGGN